MPRGEEEERLERLRKLVFAVHERLVYLRRVFEGTPWLNCVLVGPQDFSQAHSSAVDPDLSRRLSRLFTLGLSLSGTLAIGEGDLFIAGLAQLMEEYEHHCGSAFFDVLGGMLGETSSAGGGGGGDSGDGDGGGSAAGLRSGGDTRRVLISPAATTRRGTASDGAIRPKVGSYGDCVVYEFLKPLSNPFEHSLDFAAVVLSLCDVLDQVYMRLDAECCTQRAYFDAAVRFDARVQQHFFKLVFRTMDEVGRAIAQAQIPNVDSVILQNARLKATQQQQRV